MKNKLVLTITGFAAMFFLAWLFVSINASENKTLTGFVVKNSEYEAWGVETRQLLFKRILSVNNLPLEFQKSGTKIEIVYSVSDVVGKGDWGTVITIVNGQIKLHEK